MSDETIARRLREHGARLPEPAPDATGRAREAVLAAAPDRARRRAPRRAAALAFALAAAFTGGYAAASAGGSPGPSTLRDGWARIGTGVSVDVPPRWDGRVLYRDPSGTYGAVFQVASFELPANTGFAPPAELPPGEEDPIKAMGAGDVLVTLTTGAGAGSPAPPELSLEDLDDVKGPRVPRNHVLHRGAFCRESRCLDVKVDFGAAPDAELVDEVDRVLASIALDAGRS